MGDRDRELDELDALLQKRRTDVEERDAAKAARGRMLTEHLRQVDASMQAVADEVVVQLGRAAPARHRGQ